LEVVRVEDLYFTYGLDFKLRVPSLSVNSGELTVLLGPNGCGKTTLLKCINALVKPEKGSISIDGKDTLRMGWDRLARLVGYVPQMHQPPFPYSVIDIVLMGRVSSMGIFQQPSKSDYAKSEEALKLVGMHAFRDRPYTQISGGERQLVLIARAIAQEPKVLLLDEPTAHLDFKNQLVVLGTVKRIARERGIAVVTSLHDPNHTLLFADTVVLMSNGTVFAAGRPDEVVTEANIESVYAMEVEVIEHHRSRFVLPRIK
jgi:iron complex transport system ATP-binding protein